MKRALGITINILISVISLVIFFIVLEISLAIYQSQSSESGEPGKTEQPIPHYIITDEPYIYRMNPEHNKTNKYGLRDTNFPLKKPQGHFRILVLGDSVAYGRIVRSSWTFPNRAETLLNEANTSNQYQHIEVINAGISGYTPYNELHYYLEEGRKFDADLVILAFCMNDVANPRLHWNYTKEKIAEIPDAAIPNKQYDREVIQPLIDARRNSIRRKLHGTKSLVSALTKQTKTYQFTASLLQKIFPSDEEKAIQRRAPVITTADKNIPTHITGEDSISIEVLTNSDSVEWRWLTNIYDQIHAAVQADGIPLVIAWFPLAYQLDPGYPHFPQELFKQYCEERGIPCLDFLPAFNNYGKEKVFMLDQDGGYDVWHLKKDGHFITGEILYNYLLENKLTPVQ